MSHATVSPSAPSTKPEGTEGERRQARTALGGLQFRTFDALHHGPFRLLWFGQGCVAMSIWMDQVARGWLVYQLTDSPFQLGLIRGLQAIPLLLLSPVAGTVADRYDRKVQMVVSQVLDGLMYTALAVLIFTGEIQVWHVYVTAFLGSAVQTFQHPARMAMVADSVPHTHLTNAIALNSVLFNLSRSTGPAFAGLLIATTGTGASFLVQGALYFLATVWTVPLPSALRFPSATHGRRHEPSASFVRSTLEGWTFSWSNEGVRTGLVITTLASLFIIPFTTLFPVFARDILQVGASGQGFLLTAMGLGAFVSAVLVASLADQLPRGMFMLAGVTLYGLSVVAFAASPWFPLSVVLMVVVGLFHVSSHTLVQTVIQTHSPSELRGRTNAVFQQSHVVMLLGAMALGGLASLWGAPWATITMAAAGALAVFGVAVASPGARAIR